jgi:hypothetical protein
MRVSLGSLSLFYQAEAEALGRKRMYTIGSVFVGVFGFIYFALLDTKVPAGARSAPIQSARRRRSVPSNSWHHTVIFRLRAIWAARTRSMNSGA